MAEPTLLLPRTLVFEPMSADIRFRGRFDNRENWVTVLTTLCNLLLQTVDPCQGVVEQVLVVAHLHLQLLLNSRQDQICDRISVDLGAHSCREEGDSILCHKQKIVLFENSCFKTSQEKGEEIVVKPLKMRERKVLQTRSIMMDE